MTYKTPVLMWFRRDLRLSDHAALTGACSPGHPVIRLFIHGPLGVKLGAAMNRGADIVRPFVRLGEQAAQDRLAQFTADIIAGYKENRNLPAVDGTSKRWVNNTGPPILTLFATV